MKKITYQKKPNKQTHTEKWEKTQVKKSKILKVTIKTWIYGVSSKRNGTWINRTA